MPDVPQADISMMERIVQAIEAAAELPPYREPALSWAPDIAGFDPGPIGAFMGYDFHLGPDGPQLIEINTNAGGAFLNTLLARAQHRCCDPSQPTAGTNRALDGFEDAAFAMFQQEWQRQGRNSTPRRLAIVDDAPASQFMFLEFQLAQQLFQARGIETLILDPSELEYVDGALSAHGKPIDMVYNRLLDFVLEAPGHGSKGVYRSEKLTRRVFEEILKGDYIAQNFVPAGELTLRVDGTVTTRKVDIRLYTYAGQLLLAAARVYQGQATNFRTPGGGFAPVFVV